jgi:hypothetical protein
VIRQHAEWLVSANVDFIYIDWSNDIDTGITGAAGQGRQVYLENTSAPKLSGSRAPSLNVPGSVVS